MAFSGLSLPSSCLSVRQKLARASETDSSLTVRLWGGGAATEGKKKTTSFPTCRSKGIWGIVLFFASSEEEGDARWAGGKRRGSDVFTAQLHHRRVSEASRTRTSQAESTNQQPRTASFKMLLLWVFFGGQGRDLGQQGSWKNRLQTTFPQLV